MKKEFCSLLIVAVVLASACISGNAVYQKKYGDYNINFRADLNEAKKIPVYPGEDELKKTMFDWKHFAFHIAYLPNEAENGFYTVSGFELASKLVLSFKKYYKIENPYIQNTEDGFMCMIFGDNVQYGRTLCLKTVPLNSTDEVENFANVTRGDMVIFMKGPAAGAEETSVIVGENGVITLQGKDFSEENRKYTDLDLAVDKFVTVLLEAPPRGLKDFTGE